MHATDPTTGLPNHRAWLSQLALRVQAGEPFSLLLLDLDVLKALNGFPAYQGGDWLLQRTGEEVVGVSPAAARTYRIGADAFAVLVETTAARDLVELGKRNCAAIAAIEVPGADEPDPGPSRVTCSVGAARFSVDGQTAADLVAVADQCMSMAKHMGRGRIALADTNSLPWFTDARASRAGTIGPGSTDD